MKMQKKFEETMAYPKLMFAVATVNNLKLMLMSAHPDSDGMFCRVHLAIAQEVFEQRRKELELDYLIVGMDTNIQLGESATFPAEIKLLGYKVLWPEHVTVNKQRTFLQSQIKKAAKLDKIQKDTLFVYPDKEEDTYAATVFNGFKQTYILFCPLEHFTETYSSGFFPTSSWPMDHFITKASQTHSKTKASDAKLTKEPGADCSAEKGTKALSVARLKRTLRKFIHFAKRASRK